MMLVSDFRDYYDHAFGIDGMVFRRMTTEGLAKPEQFRLLEQSGYRVPRHGPLRELLADGSKWPRAAVGYEDPFAHCGDGKRLILDSAFPQWLHSRGDVFASEFIGDSQGRPSVTWRLLQIGRHNFWIEYRGRTDWRSNFGDVECEVIDVGLSAGLHPSIRHPLFAIDFAIAAELVAIDFNTAPGMRGSGVERHLKPGAVVEAIREAMAR